MPRQAEEAPLSSRLHHLKTQDDDDILKKKKTKASGNDNNNNNSNNKFGTFSSSVESVEKKTKRVEEEEGVCVQILRFKAVTYGTQSRTSTQSNLKQATAVTTLPAH